ncbi:MAG: hypothetical protein UW31_C0004G0068 [Candidatus Collierbacteria bacterium GW2011_GWA2_44_13]|nr:MAG: hypothetical protein UW31_C0004G0068 [Candidatus Collierbacteria bacterium GW2011_GWA2_44_13]
MKPVILTDFADIGHNLEEFPEFLTLAKQEGLKNFADALKEYRSFSLSGDRRLKLMLAQFILWLGMASVGDFRVLVGKSYKVLNRYETMEILIPFVQELSTMQVH